MLTPGLSSTAQSAAQRLLIQRIQTQLSQAQTEAASGRVADPAQTLGAKTGNLVAMEARIESLTAIVDSNALATSRLKATDLALDGVSQAADKLQQLLVNARAGLISAADLTTQAKGLMQETISSLNASLNGEALFGGVNAGEAPFADYFGPPASAARASVTASFTAAFGAPPDDPATASISGAAMQGYLSGAFATVFDDANWAASWSNASDDLTRNRIGEGQIVDGGVSANAQPIRKLMMAYAMTADLASGALGGDALNAVVTQALSVLGSASEGITQIRAEVGVTLSRIEASNTREAAKKDLLSLAVGDLVDVDPYELSTRISDLQSRLEASYSLTARLHELTLTKYL